MDATKNERIGTDYISQVAYGMAVGRVSQRGGTMAEVEDMAWRIDEGAEYQLSLMQAEVEDELTWGVA